MTSPENIELKSDKLFFIKEGRSKTDTTKLSCFVIRNVFTDLKKFRNTEGELVGNKGKFTKGKLAS